ncbi:helix-turn-helix domain-containing protein [Amycolatopsis anabasis]|uniref:helix-turn-helix domain-containing protein n=1 Tax=Amycolatopsis anabasis TaxID=1840409 RepID=UPI00131E8CC5|nr:helix-turn-helix domain-containing protein [Amycolatopsis anabasis]
MRNLALMRQTSLPRWKALLAELARREHLLLEGVMAHFEGGSRHYAGLVDAEDFRNSSVDALRYLLGQLADGRAPRELADLPRQIGIHRAAQGVPLENVVATVREDFTILWSTLLRVSRSADMPVLISHVDDLWRVVDDFASEIHVSYLRESAARANLDLGRQRAMISALFSSTEPHAGLLRQIAGTLGVPEDGAFDVIATDHADRERLDAFLARAGARVFTGDFEDSLVAFWTPAPGVDRHLAAVRCGRAPRAGTLAEVPVRARSAVRILRALPPAATGPATMAEAWPRLAAARLAEVSPEFPAHRLDEIPEAERDRLLETAREFLDTGSIATTAERLFCHRNTVLNRLRRLRELIALDLTIPRQAALALVLLSRMD